MSYNEKQCFLVELGSSSVEICDSFLHSIGRIVTQMEVNI